MTQRRFARDLSLLEDVPAESSPAEARAKPRAAPAQARSAQARPAPRKARRARLFAPLALALAGFACPLAYWTAAGTLAVNPAALVLLAALGSILIFCALIARRAAEEARAQSAEVLALARRAFLPATGDDPVALFAARIRAELAAVDEAAERAGAKLGALDHAASRHVGALGDALSRLEAQTQAARTGFAEEVKTIDGLGKEMAALLREWRRGSQSGAETLSGAQEALKAGCAEIAQLSATLAARTAALHEAGASAKGAAGSLDLVLSRALAALAESTSLNETSRRSIDIAAESAAAAATAVRDAICGVAAIAATEPVSVDQAGRTAWRGFSGAATRPERARPPYEVFEAAGVNPEAALPAQALRSIAQSAQGGRAAQREAVREVAEAAVERLERYLRRAPAARIKADQFRSEPGFSDPGGDAETGRRLARAYLLLDAALG